MAVTTTSRLGITRWSAGTDPFSRAQMDASHAALEGVVAMYSQTAASGRPAFGKQGRFHVASDTDVITYDNGAAWQNVKAVPTAHSHAIADLPVAASGSSSATLLVRADDSRLSNARTPTAHSHAIADLPVAASGVSSSTALVRADDSRLLPEFSAGMMVVWPVPRTVPLPAGWDRATGQVVARTGTYAGVFAVYGTTWNTGGESASDFRLPNPAERFLIGSTGAAGNRPLGSYGGTASRTILETNLPAHTHTMVHTHDIGHGHTASTNSTGSHSHGGATVAGGGTYYGIPTALVDSGTSWALSPSGGFGGRVLVAANGNPFDSHAHGINADGNHSHSVTVNAHAGSSGASSAASTGSVGGNTALDILNPYAAVDWIIKL